MRTIITALLLFALLLGCRQQDSQLDQAPLLQLLPTNTLGVLYWDFQNSAYGAFNNSEWGQRQMAEKAGEPREGNAPLTVLFNLHSAAKQVGLLASSEDRASDQAALILIEEPSDNLTVGFVAKLRDASLTSPLTPKLNALAKTHGVAFASDGTLLALAGREITAKNILSQLGKATNPQIIAAAQTGPLSGENLAYGYLDTARFLGLLAKLQQIDLERFSPAAVKQICTAQRLTPSGPTYRMIATLGSPLPFTPPALAPVADLSIQSSAALQIGISGATLAALMESALAFSPKDSQTRLEGLRALAKEVRAVDFIVSADPNMGAPLLGALISSTKAAALATQITQIIKQEIPQLNNVVWQGKSVAGAATAATQLTPQLNLMVANKGEGVLVTNSEQAIETFFTSASGPKMPEVASRPSAHGWGIIDLQRLGSLIGSLSPSQPDLPSRFHFALTLTSSTIDVTIEPFS